MRITHDTANGGFAFEDRRLHPFGASIEARLARHGRVVEFDGLEFGLSVTRNGGAPETHRFPPPGVTYRSTDQDRLTTVPVRWRPDDRVVLDVWITNGGITRRARHSLTVPRPPQPYPSWRWGGTGWEAPLPYPGVGALYDWDEAAGEWVAMV
jgi:hypothetical protein